MIYANIEFKIIKNYLVFTTFRPLAFYQASKLIGSYLDALSMSICLYQQRSYSKINATEIAILSLASIINCDYKDSIPDT